MAENPFESPEVVRNALDLLRLAHLNIKSLDHLQLKKHQMTFNASAFAEFEIETQQMEEEVAKLDGAIALARRLNDKIMDAYLKLAGEDADVLES